MLAGLGAMERASAEPRLTANQLPDRLHHLAIDSPGPQHAIEIAEAGAHPRAPFVDDGELGLDRTLPGVRERLGPAVVRFDEHVEVGSQPRRFARQHLSARAHPGAVPEDARAVLQRLRALKRRGHVALFLRSRLAGGHQRDAGERRRQKNDPAQSHETPRFERIDPVRKRNTAQRREFSAKRGISVRSSALVRRLPGRSTEKLSPLVYSATCFRTFVRRRWVRGMQIACVP